MINSVSNVSFKAQTPQELINSPGRFTTAPQTAPKADEFAPSQGKKKSKAPMIIGITSAVLVAAAVTLGILAGKGKLPEKTPEFLKNAGSWLSDNAKNAWKWATGLISKGEAV